MENFDYTTLLIKHLPHELDVNDRIDLLKHLGAADVKCIASKVKKNSLTFAKFKTKQEAESVLKELHQKEVLGKLLSVEYAKENESGKIVHSDLSKVYNEADYKTSHRKLIETYVKKLNSWTNDLNFNQPPPSHIRYQYPPPSTESLKNICKALANVPKFYTQVLHLMNKMNLPCPFTEHFNIESNLVHDSFFEEPQKAQINISDEESEIESDGNEERHMQRPTEKTTVAKNKMTIKLPKMVKFMPVSVDRQQPLISRDEVFETSQVHTKKKIELKVSSDLSSLAASREQPQETESFGILEPKPSSTEENVESKEEPSTTTSAVSSEELELNRIPSKDFHLLPVFKNYQAGAPTCRLYIKNLSKSVQVNDLEFIYNRYRKEESEDEINLFDVRLMQEGRMKGQAFVTLQNTTLAEQAVKETNGYILRGKAMVVQFARSSKPK